MFPAERLLVLLLRLAGAVTLCAALALPLPTEWMSRIHEALGLGPFPAAPLTEYLTRSISALYAAQGVLSLVVSRDVRRLRPVVVYLGWFHVGFGAVMTVIDRVAGMPWWWTLAEGPGVFGAGVVVLVLVRWVPRWDGSRSR